MDFRHWRSAGVVAVIFATVLLVTGCQMLEPTATPSPAEVAELVEEAVAAYPLAATAWDLDFIGEPGDSLELLPETRATLVYFWDRYAGFDGCNWFLGAYSATDAGELSMFTPARTRDLCSPEEVYEQSLLVVGALQNATAFAVTDDQLVVSTVDDQRLLTFNPATPIPVPGTEWELKFWWHGEREEWLPVIPGSMTTITFAAGGEASGSAGCNNYTTTYTGDLQIEKVMEATETYAELPALTFGPVAAQLMECAEPEGIMEQEQGFLTTLSSVAYYFKLGGITMFLDADGMPLLLFGARN